MWALAPRRQEPRRAAVASAPRTYQAYYEQLVRSGAGAESLHLPNFPYFRTKLGIDTSKFHHMAYHNFPKIALLREGKVPPDSRVAFSPTQVAQLRAEGLDVVVVPSENRIYTDEEYRALGIPLTKDIADRELLIGIKEVKIEELVPNKTYCFFAHVHKKQVHNRPLLQALLANNIRHIDYEVMTNEQGQRLIAFGYFAGVVGAHNGIWAYGQRSGQFRLPRMKDCFDYAAAKHIYQQTDFGPLKVVLTGGGRVASGAAQVLEDMGFERLQPEDFLAYEGAKAVFAQINCRQYARRKDGQAYSREDFYAHPSEYESSFLPYTQAADVFINGIYWDAAAPAFFTRQEMQDPNFRIRTIADVTCDIAPISSVPSTIKASTIADPVFGYNPTTNEAVAPFQSQFVDVMSIDNLPSEMPRDASAAFGEMFMEHILPEFGKEESAILNRATITKDGALGKHFGYLADFTAGH